MSQTGLQENFISNLNNPTDVRDIKTGSDSVIRIMMINALGEIIDPSGGASSRYIAPNTSSTSLSNSTDVVAWGTITIPANTFRYDGASARYMAKMVLINNTGSNQSWVIGVDINGAPAWSDSTGGIATSSASRLVLIDITLTRYTAFATTFLDVSGTLTIDDANAAADGIGNAGVTAVRAVAISDNAGVATDFASAITISITTGNVSASPSLAWGSLISTISIN